MKKVKEKIYPNRFEVKLNDTHVKILNAMAKKYHKTASEIIREAILEAWEKV